MCFDLFVGIRHRCHRRHRRHRHHRCHRLLQKHLQLEFIVVSIVIVVILIDEFEARPCGEEGGLGGLADVVAGDAARGGWCQSASLITHPSDSRTCLASMRRKGCGLLLMRVCPPCVRAF